MTTTKDGIVGGRIFLSPDAPKHRPGCGRRTNTRGARQSLVMRRRATKRWLRSRRAGGASNARVAGRPFPLRRGTTQSTHSTSRLKPRRSISSVRGFFLPQSEKPLTRPALVPALAGFYSGLGCRRFPFGRRHLSLGLGRGFFFFRDCSPHMFDRMWR
jgi:hypothetical protein